MQVCGHAPIWSGQRVLRTNARGRHTYLAEFKHWIVEQAQLPGMSLAGLAMNNQVNANQLRRWVQLHGKPSQATAVVPSLLRVTVAAARLPHANTARPGAAVEIEVGDTLVRVRDGVTPATLRMVLACLRGSTP